MLLLLKPRRLSAPVDFADADQGVWTEAEALGLALSDSIGWYELGLPNKRPKRNTLLSTHTSGIPPSASDERRRLGA